MLEFIYFTYMDIKAQSLIKNDSINSVTTTTYLLAANEESTTTNYEEPTTTTYQEPYANEGLSPDLFIGFLISGFIFALIAVKIKKKSSNVTATGYRKCSYCSERIPSDARVCRSCNRTLI